MSWLEIGLASAAGCGMLLLAMMALGWMGLKKELDQREDDDLAWIVSSLQSAVILRVRRPEAPVPTERDCFDAAASQDYFGGSKTVTYSIERWDIGYVHRVRLSFKPTDQRDGKIVAVSDAVQRKVELGVQRALTARLKEAGIDPTEVRIDSSASTTLVRIVEFRLTPGQQKTLLSLDHATAARNL